jgi:hypothetical protein
MGRRDVVPETTWEDLVEWRRRDRVRRRRDRFVMVCFFDLEAIIVATSSCS